jgi:hypothetical protein
MPSEEEISIPLGKTEHEDRFDVFHKFGAFTLILSEQHDRHLSEVALRRS